MKKDSFRSLRLRQLDSLLNQFRALLPNRAPRGGWVREIRQALGMTTAQLAKRMSVTQPAITALEHSERDGTITLNSLKKAAQALDAELIYAVVPREGLEQILEKRIRQLATDRVRRVAHTMTLEEQQVSNEYIQRQIDELVQEMLAAPPKNLWSWTS